MDDEVRDVEIKKSVRVDVVDKARALRRAMTKRDVDSANINS